MERENHVCEGYHASGRQKFFCGRGNLCVRGMPNVKESRPKSVIGKALRSRDAKDKFAAAYPQILRRRRQLCRKNSR